MSKPLVFIDTETDGLHPGRKAWEIAMIRRDHLGTTETAFFLPLDLRDSDPSALQIGRFWDRHPSGRKMAGLKALPDSVNLLTQHDAAKEVMRWTFGAHLVGAIPSFDAEVFARMLRSNGYLPSWHHRLYCVESIVMGHFGRPVGGLRACAEAVGVEVPDGAEHTAMGDARTVAAIWDVVMAGGVRMSTMLPESAIRVLVTPCGCWVGADATDEIPGFCRSEDEAREDLRLGLTEVRAPVEDARKRLGECPHGIYMAGGAS